MQPAPQLSKVASTCLVIQIAFDRSTANTAMDNRNSKIMSASPATHHTRTPQCRASNSLQCCHVVRPKRSCINRSLISHVTKLCVMSQSPTNARPRKSLFAYSFFQHVTANRHILRHSLFQSLATSSSMTCTRDAVGSAIRKCPFLHQVSADQGEEYARKIVTRPALPAAAAGHRPVFEEHSCDFEATLKLFHGPSGVVPLKQVAASLAQAPQYTQHSSDKPRQQICNAPFASMSMAGAFNFLVSICLVADCLLTVISPTGWLTLDACAAWATRCSQCSVRKIAFQAWWQTETQPEQWSQWQQFCKRRCCCNRCCSCKGRRSRSADRAVSSEEVPWGQGVPFSSPQQATP